MTGPYEVGPPPNSSIVVATDVEGPDESIIGAFECLGIPRLLQNSNNPLGLIVIIAATSNSEAIPSIHMRTKNICWCYGNVWRCLRVSGGQYVVGGYVHCQTYL